MLPEHEDDWMGYCADPSDYEMDLLQEERFWETIVSNVVTLMLTYGFENVSYAIRARYDKAREALEEVA